MKLNDEYKVKIESFDMNGLGVCHLDNKVVFVENAMEGEEVIISITSIHSKYVFSYPSISLFVFISHNCFLSTEK